MKKVSTILLVDDDLDDQTIFIDTVTEIDSSIACFSAYNGEEALYILQNNLSLSPDYIFVDLNMPKMGGKQFLREIKRLYAFKNIPVIIYTTSSTLRDKEDTRNLGAAYFLTKPGSVSALRGELERLLQ